MLAAPVVETKEVCPCMHHLSYQDLMRLLALILVHLGRVTNHAFFGKATNTTCCNNANHKLNIYLHLQVTFAVPGIRLCLAYMFIGRKIAAWVIASLMCTWIPSHLMWSNSSKGLGIIQWVRG